MRRNSGLASQVIVLPPFQIDLSRRELSVGEQQIKLTAFEYTIIETLIRRKPHHRRADGPPAQKTAG
jgi:two-component system response regulator PhoP